MNFRQLRSFVAVYEEGSFSRAAARENATQSGLSMQMRKLEDRLGVRLFERSAHGVVPTVAGKRYYDRCLPILNAMMQADEEMHDMAGTVAGRVTVGMIPSIARSALAPVLSRYADAFPNVELRLIEAFSATLTEQVRAQELDCAVVPPTADTAGLEMRLLARDHEVLLSANGVGAPRLTPVRLADLPPLKLILPAPQNARRPVLDAHMAAHGIAVARVMELDAMMATFDLVAHSDWATILPLTACLDDLQPEGGGLWLNPIVDPAIVSDFVLINPASRPLSTAAHHFVDAFAEELLRSTALWDDLVRQAS
jgi:LysR family nitrogen assimilation transcriptional regulator